MKVSTYFLKRQLHSTTKISDLIDFFPQKPDGDGPRSKFEKADDQTDCLKDGTCNWFWRIWCHLVIMQF